MSAGTWAILWTVGFVCNVVLVVLVVVNVRARWRLLEQLGAAQTRYWDLWLKVGGDTLSTEAAEWFEAERREDERREAGE